MTCPKGQGVKATHWCTGTTIAAVVVASAASNLLAIAQALSVKHMLSGVWLQAEPVIADVDCCLSQCDSPTSAKSIGQALTLAVCCTCSAVWAMVEALTFLGRCLLLLFFTLRAAGDEPKGHCFCPCCSCPPTYPQWSVRFALRVSGSGLLPAVSAKPYTKASSRCSRWP